MRKSLPLVLFACLALCVAATPKVPRPAIAVNTKMEAPAWAVLERRPGWNRFSFSRKGVLRGGAARGRLVGGCLSLLVSLIGTPYDLDSRGAILFWEEVGEEPYKIDRMLNHLRMAGKLRHLRGMVVGRLQGCEAKGSAAGLPLPEILRDHLRGTDFPVVINFPAGHAPGKVTLPLGLPARLDTRTRSTSPVDRVR